MNPSQGKIWNIPNTLTLFRVIFAVLMFVCLEVPCYWGAVTFFLIAALTDYVDGWWARKFKQITVFGRIMDPFADKLLVCGALIYLAAVPAMLQLPWGLRGWMAVVIVGRELLVTTIRAFLEQHGQDFSAKWIGKFKMWCQCIAIPACMIWLALKSEQPDWLYALIIVSLWGSVLTTIYSGYIYVIVASKIISARK
jgi:CDP-diacylglycerol--glycerol-3-phosphate 3-phosphatidyltransferase